MTPLKPHYRERAMLNRTAAAAFKACLVATLWFQEVPLQSGRAHAEITCESQPCDCNGPFETPLRSIELEELVQSIAAHQEWLSDRGSDPEHWTLEAQIEQYDPIYNPPDSDEGKYSCGEQRNGPFLQDKVEFGRHVAQANALARTDLRGPCFRKSDVRDVILNNTNLRGANFLQI
jgi:hypothetical protein